MTIIYLFITYYQFCYKSNKTGAISGAGTAYSAVCSVAQSAGFFSCVVFCKSLLVLFPLAIVLSVLRLTASDYPFGLWYIQTFLKVVPYTTGR